MDDPTHRRRRQRGPGDDKIESCVVAPPQKSAQQNKTKPQQQHTAPIHSDIVTFNCGGEIIPVQKSFILRTAPDSFLAMYLSQDDEERQGDNNNINQDEDCLSSGGSGSASLRMLDRDEHGHILLDRDPRLFRAVVNFCRGYRNVGPLGEEEMKALLQEADAWCLPELHAIVARHLEMSTGAVFASSVLMSSANNNNNNNNMNGLTGGEDADFPNVSSSASQKQHPQISLQQRKQQMGRGNNNNAAIIPPHMRFVRGPGVNAERTRVRNNFTVGIVGDKDTGAPMVAGVHCIHLEVQRAEYLGFGIMQDPSGSAVLPQDQEFHRMPGSVGYYYTGVFYSNCPTPFKEEKLGTFGAGSVLQMRLDMDEKTLEFFVDGRWERLQSVACVGRARFAVVMKQDSSVRIVSPERAAHLVALQRKKADAEEERKRREAAEEEELQRNQGGELDSSNPNTTSNETQNNGLVNNGNPNNANNTNSNRNLVDFHLLARGFELVTGGNVVVPPRPLRAAPPPIIQGPQPAMIVQAHQQTPQDSVQLLRTENNNNTVSNNNRRISTSMIRPLPEMVEDDEDDGESNGNEHDEESPSSTFSDPAGSTNSAVHNNGNTSLAEDDDGNRVQHNRAEHQHARSRAVQEAMRGTFPTMSSNHNHSSLPISSRNRTETTLNSGSASLSRSLSRAETSTQNSSDMTTMTMLNGNPSQLASGEMLHNHQLHHVEFVGAFGQRVPGGGPMLVSVPRPGSRSPAAFLPPQSITGQGMNSSFDTNQTSFSSQQLPRVSAPSNNNASRVSSSNNNNSGVGALFPQQQQSRRPQSTPQMQQPQPQPQLQQLEEHRRAGAPSRARNNNEDNSVSRSTNGVQQQQQRQPPQRQQQNSTVSPSPEPTTQFL